MVAKAKALQGNLSSPGGRLGSRRARQGQPGTRHLPQAVCVFHPEHGRLRQGGQGAWAGGKGAPHDTPRPGRRGGWGLGVCAWGSHGHQDEDGRRRPPACGRTKDTESAAHKVPRARGSCPRESSRVCWRNGNRGCMVAPWRSTKGAEPDTVQAVSPVLNGGREETYSKATRLAPTQLRQQVSAGIRCLHSLGGVCFKDSFAVLTFCTLV
jgi:hypothetical protein